MLTELRFTNFKSWAKADVTCGRLTGIFGTNSSGKTSLIQFLLLMKQTKDATDRANSLELRIVAVSRRIRSWRRSYVAGRLFERVLCVHIRK